MSTPRPRPFAGTRSGRSRPSFLPRSMPMGDQVMASGQHLLDGVGAAEIRVRAVIDQALVETGDLADVAVDNADVMVTRTMVMPSPRSSRREDHRNDPAFPLTPEVGSSKKRRRGRRTIARAMKTRCCWPLDRRPTGRSRYSSMPTVARAAGRPPLRRAGRGGPPGGRSGGPWPRLPHRSRKERIEMGRFFGAHSR